jgi:dextranase
VWRSTVLLQLVWLVAVVQAQAGLIDAVSSNKARYNPGDPVQMVVNLQGPATGTQQLVVHYRHLGDVVGTQTIPVTSSSPFWTWNPPTGDFQGYLADIDLVDNGSVVDHSSFAVDVSSDWAKFPRYGFLSSYDQGTDTTEVMTALNRYHINGLQFYDWENKQHQPLAGTPQSPAASWPDIANRTNYRSTVNAYINTAHHFNMMAMSYNLVYGALDDAGASADGVQEEWYLFTDPNHTTKEKHDLPGGWLSDIYLVNPADPGWQAYIAQKTGEAFQAYAFDGWHMDQLGANTLYDYDGNQVQLDDTFKPFIDAMRANPNLAGKRVVFNSVSQYGQSQIAQSDVDFLYTEVWGHDSYNELAGIITDNNTLSNNTKNSVLAAYVNRSLGDNPGSFNTPSVLLTDAVIFAFGGDHLELGEHMLHNEYFPESNLQMSPQLQASLTSYYDFLVGYQNLLRDGGQFNDNPLASSNASLNMWPAQQGNVSVVDKTVGNDEVFHLINFSDAVHMNWRDDNGTQPEPTQISDIALSFFSHKPIGKLWAASPDVNGGVPVELEFSQASNGTVSFTLPSLKYWSMVVAEAGPFTGYDDSADPQYAGSWGNGSNGGSGFGAWQLVSTSTPGGYAGFWHPDDSSESNGIDNAGAIDRDSGSTWASYANKGSGVDKATAFRAFDTSLEGAGDTFSVTLENGSIEGRVGLSLRNGDIVASPDDYASGARMQFYFQGGETNYSLTDGSGTLDTGIAWSPFGVKLDLTLTGPDSYDLLIWRFDEANDRSPQVYNIQGRTLAGQGTIDSLALFQYDTTGSGIQSDVFFNYLSYLIANAAALNGDYNQDGVIDAADYTVWRDAMAAGSTTLPNDPTPGTVDESDFEYWRVHFGETAGGAASIAASGLAAVPEPATLCLCTVVAISFGFVRYVATPLGQHLTHAR